MKPIHINTAKKQIPIMQMKDTIPTLMKFPLLKGLDDAKLEPLSKILEHRLMQDSEIVFHENDVSHDIYFIQSGVVEIFKEGHVISTLEAGESFGELAFLDKTLRSASARAVGKTKLIVILQDKLEQLENGGEIYNTLLANIAQSSSERLRSITGEHVKILEEQLEILRTQHEFGQFFIYILVSYAISLMINGLLHTYLTSINVYSHYFTWTYLIILLIPALSTLWILKIPLSQVGVTSENWKKSLTEGVIVSGVFAIIASSLMYWEVVTFKPSFFSFDALSKYLASAGIQELVARGFVLTSFQRFFSDQKGIKSVFLTSVLFGLFHIHFGFTAVLVTFVSGMFFGAFYLRHHNLLGVTIFHWVAGTCAFGISLI